MDANLVAFIAIGAAAGASGLAAVLAAKLYAAQLVKAQQAKRIAELEATRDDQLAENTALARSNELLGEAVSDAAERMRNQEMILADLRAITPKRGSNGKFLARANGAAKAKVAGAGTRV